MGGVLYRKGKYTKYLGKYFVPPPFIVNSNAVLFLTQNAILPRDLRIVPKISQFYSYKKGVYPKFSYILLDKFKVRQWLRQRILRKFQMVFKGGGW